MKLPEAVLTMGAGAQVKIADEQQLGPLLAELGRLKEGEIAALERGPSDFIKAIRHGELWSVTTKRGRMWMTQSFTAAATSEYSERRTQQSRTVDSLRQRLRWWLRSPAPERALSTKQVQTLFAEYASGQRFTLPFSGA